MGYTHVDIGIRYKFPVVLWNLLVAGSGTGKSNNYHLVGVRAAADTMSFLV
jgi:hypothetical protein